MYKYGIESVVCQYDMMRHLFCQRRQYFVQCFIKRNNSVSFDDSVSHHQAIDEIEFCLAEIRLSPENNISSFRRKPESSTPCLK